METCQKYVQAIREADTTGSITEKLRSQLQRHGVQDPDAFVQMPLKIVKASIPPPIESKGILRTLNSAPFTRRVVCRNTLQP